MAITTILKRMEKEPTWFYIVLPTIIPLEDQPKIPKKSAGDIIAQTEIWIKWGYQKGYLNES